MDDKSVVVTGANSYLGSTFVRFLVEKKHWRVYALVSHRSAQTVLELHDESRVTVFRSDLTQALPDNILQVASQADAIIQFAWTRDRRLDRACELNRRMIEPLLACTSDPPKFHFISTVAASPTARSVYGRSKFELAQYVTQQGGVAVACGLVTDDPPRGPYALLSRCVKSLPLRVRFTGQGPLVYPIRIDDVCARLAEAVDAKLMAGTYKLCKSPIPMNDFLAGMEQDYPRPRIPIPINTQTLLSIASPISRLRFLPGRLGDNVLTFFQKDELYLNSLPDLPSLG